MKSFYGLLWLILLGISLELNAREHPNSELQPRPDLRNKIATIQKLPQSMASQAYFKLGNQFLKDKDYDRAAI